VRLKPGTACASHDPAGEEFAEFLSLTAGAQSGHRRSGDFDLTDSRFANEIGKPLPIPFFLGLLFWMKKHQPLSFWGYFG